MIIRRQRDVPPGAVVIGDKRTSHAPAFSVERGAGRTAPGMEQ
jgi:hypothetical protein